MTLDLAMHAWLPEQGKLGERYVYGGVAQCVFRLDDYISTAETKRPKKMKGESKSKTFFAVHFVSVILPRRSKCLPFWMYNFLGNFLYIILSFRVCILCVFFFCPCMIPNVNCILTYVTCVLQFRYPLFKSFSIRKK